MRPTVIESPPLTSCLPEGVADKAKIVVLGAYEGGTQTALGIEGEQHDVGTIAVAANSDGPPLVVVVTAYDPVIWDFRNVPKKRIRAVVAYGYANQAIAGVSREVPVGQRLAVLQLCGRDQRRGRAPDQHV